MEATILVDGVYIGKSAYLRSRVINTAKMATVILGSAVASPVVGVALSALADAGFSYIDGKLNRATPPNPATGTGTVCYDSGSGCASGWPIMNGVSYIGYVTAVKPGANSFEPVQCINADCTRVDLFYRQNGSRYDVLLRMGQPAPGTPVPVASASDPAALSQLQSSLSAMTPTVAHNLAEYARGQGIDLGTFTEYNGDVIAGPFDFPLPTKTSSYIDPNTGYRYDTNVVESVHVAQNTDPATKEADPLVLSQPSTQTDKVTKPDGSSTTQTTTKTTGQGTNVNNPNNAPTPDPQAPFAGPAVTSVYTAKTKTFSDVLSKFQTSVKAAPWYAAAAGFFTVTIAGGSCPHWSMPANRWMPALDAGQFVCSSTMLALYATGGVVVLIVAAWAAFRIAFL